MDTLNTTIADYDNEISRLEQGKDITRSRKIHVRVNMEYRKSCKEKLMSGIYTPWEFLNLFSISKYIFIILVLYFTILFIIIFNKHQLNFFR